MKIKNMIKKYCYIHNHKTNKKDEYETMKIAVQHSFFDVENRLTKLTKKKDPLVKLSTMIKW